MRCLSLVLILIAIPVRADSLKERLEPLAQAHEGSVAIAVKHLDTGETFFLHADEPMPTASLIKLPILMEMYLQAREGKVDLNQMLTLDKDEMVPGSGILTDHFSPGASFCLKDASRLMIVFSDNTATNMVLDVVGIKAVNTRMEKLGFPNTKINAKVFRGSTTSVDPARTKKYGLGSTTAREMVTLIEQIHAGQLGTREDCDAIIAVMKKCDDQKKFPRLLPREVTVAHKTGSVSDARTDAGILYFKGGPVAICVLTSENKDQRWTSENAGDTLCARVAKEVHDYFKK